MPTPQEKLEQDLRRVRKLEELIQHPKLSDRGKSKLGSALRIQKVVVILGIREMAVCSEPPPREARTKRDMGNPGPDELLEQFNRGLVYNGRVREVLNSGQLNALSDMLLGWALHVSTNPKYSAWLTGIAEGLLAEADALGPDWTRPGAAPSQQPTRTEP
jgi:hypothetical protein